MHAREYVKIFKSPVTNMMACAYISYTFFWQSFQIYSHIYIYIWKYVTAKNLGKSSNFLPCLRTFSFFFYSECSIPQSLKKTINDWELRSKKPRIARLLGLILHTGVDFECGHFHAVIHFCHIWRTCRTSFWTRA